MAPMTLPPGFRFHPTDEELVAYYLDRKISGRTIELEIIPEVDLYKCEPWDLPDKSFLPSKDMEWYFYSPRDKKYPNGSRTNRATRGGYWKATGKDRTVQTSGKRAVVGMKKTLVYYRGRAPHGVRTNWVMHEYRLLHSASPTASSSLKDSYSLCRIFKKNIQIPKTKTTIVNNQSFGEEISREREAEGDVEDENFITSSSDVTQGTPNETGMADEFQPPFASDEANSSVDLSFLGSDFSSDLNQEMQIPGYTNVHYQAPYPPLDLEDFPQINIILETKASKSEIIDDYMMYDKYKDYMNGSLEEIFSLCASQDNSIPPLSMHD
ncbi:NAC domain-containing protein 45 [Hibiscus syriacus]|uniref:NAC domain-containing protein 45 n=1 Tax=Hibiscus syriacus TaxID=106335 RepID=A0A6A2ZRM3_HIBSY|nr:NAC domain-containing protein 71-like [Hibiscus syriacus]KAE8693555.1 NAC domain-containing protein 45 [Hibiscus syriacus]